MLDQTKTLFSLTRETLPPRGRINGHVSIAARRGRLLLAAVGVLVAVTGRSFGSINTFTDFAAWQAAVAARGGLMAVEPFDATGLQPFTRVVSTDGGIGPASGALSGSVWKDTVSRSLGESTTFSYQPGQAFGAGALWDTSVNGYGQGLIISGIAQIGPISGSFFGWVSSEPLNSLTIVAGTQQGGLETFDMDNLTFAVIPEPAPGLLLLVGGLILLSALGRRVARA